MTSNLPKNTPKAALAQIEELIEGNAVLQESFEAATASLMSLRSEDQGWEPLNTLNNGSGFTLDNLQDIAEKAELQVTGSALLKRGLTLRTSNVFGKGVQFQASRELPPRYQQILDKPWNESVLFTQDAFSRNERSLFVTGNLIMAYRQSTKTFFPIPFSEITASASNPDLVQDVWYYQRSWTETDLTTGQPKTNPTVEWYPVLEKYEEGTAKLAKKLGEYPVRSDVIIIDLKVNTSIGSVWGVPDCLPALPYAWAHAEYIRDASKLLKALSTIAWKVVARSKANASTASVKMGKPNVKGSTASMTEGTDLVAMPRAGQVNMKDGQSIAGYVASALEVSLIALLSDPGTASGSYGAAASLDGPSANSARARQQLWQQFYRRIYRAIGFKDIVVNFPKIAEDPVYRIAQTLQIGFAYGAIHQDEFRAAYLEASDVKPLHDEVPEPTVFTTAAKFSAEAEVQAEKQAQADAEAAINAANVQGQGQSDGINASAGNNDLRDAEHTPGTGNN